MTLIQALRDSSTTTKRASAYFGPKQRYIATVQCQPGAERTGPYHLHLSMPAAFLDVTVTDILDVHTHIQRVTGILPDAIDWLGSH